MGFDAQILLPKIIILMPILNESPYLTLSIGSIQNQEFTNWELIVQDNCSTDNSVEIVRNISKSDKRVVLLQNQSRLSVGLNWEKLASYVLANKPSEFIVWIGGDDTWSNEQFLSKKVDFLTSNRDFHSVAPRLDFCLNGVLVSSSCPRADSNLCLIRTFKFLTDKKNLGSLWALSRREVFESIMREPSYKIDDYAGFDYFYTLGLFVKGKVALDSGSSYLKTQISFTGKNDSNLNLNLREKFKIIMKYYVDLYWNRRVKILSLPLWIALGVFTQGLSLSLKTLYKSILLRCKKELHGKS